MEQIRLNELEINFLSESYKGLTYNETNNTISGILSFYRSYNGKKVKGKYSIEFKLEHGNNSILPKVRETKGKILSIAKRKKISRAEVHLNNEEGEMCLIFPVKETEFYPNGFEFKRFMNHIETHLYWVTFYDRYDKKPWKDEPHCFNDALFLSIKENKDYRKYLKINLEEKLKIKLTRPEFRRYLKKNNLL
ncbi:MAG: hypothetical protein DRJ01_10085 [Bacteroidetes bacterium]|nr:MAG: hypothetical protein DRJ01_10085 [Bacteroidota bacterium]